MRGWLGVALVALGCAPTGGGADSVEPDAAPLDAATLDATAEVDAATLDAAVDAETADAAPPIDGPPRCPEVAVGPPPAGLDPFYTQHVDVRGLPLIAGPGVPEAAFRVAAYTLENMLAERPCAREAIIAAGIRFGIMGPDDVTTDMPEYSDFYEAFPGTDWDTRGRGFGGTLERPLTTGAVENLLQSPADPWFGENIFLHEVAHTLFEFGVEDLDGGAAHRARLEALYAEAMATGLWVDTYAATNANEYWAEAVQSHFESNLSAEPPDGVHNHVDTRAELRAYDPAMADFVAARVGTRVWWPYCDPEGAGPAWTPPPAEPVDCPLRVVHARDQGCDAAALTSQHADTPVEVTLVNQGLEPVTVYWIDYEGQRQQARALGGRRRMVVQSFATHGWLVAGPDGACRHGFVTADRATRVLVP